MRFARGHGPTHEAGSYARPNGQAATSGQAAGDHALLRRAGLADENGYQLLTNGCVDLRLNCMELQQGNSCEATARRDRVWSLSAAIKSRHRSFSGKMMVPGVLKRLPEPRGSAPPEPVGEPRGRTLQSTSQALAGGGTAGTRRTRQQGQETERDCRSPRPDSVEERPELGKRPAASPR